LTRAGLPFPVNEKMSTPEARSRSTVEVEPTLAALYRDAPALEQLQVRPEAPPAFLLDTDRGRARVRPSPGTFDNRSVCLETDFPSVFLLNHGIRRAIVLQENSSSARDLTATLVSWQQAGIEILRKKWNDLAPPSSVKVQRPAFWCKLGYHFEVAFRLQAGEIGWFRRHYPFRRRMTPSHVTGESLADLFN